MFVFDAYVTDELCETLLHAIHCPYRVRRQWSLAFHARVNWVAWLLYCKLLEGAVCCMNTLISLSEWRVWCVSSAAHYTLRAQQWLCPVDSLSEAGHRHETTHQSMSATIECPEYSV